MRVPWDKRILSSESTNTDETNQAVPREREREPESQEHRFIQKTADSSKLCWRSDDNYDVPLENSNKDIADDLGKHINFRDADLRSVKSS